MSKNKVLIYMTRNCPYCIRAKAFFDEKGIPFETIDLTDQPTELQELKNRTQWKTVPQIFVNDVFIGGYTDVVEWDNDGRLKALLK